MQIFQPPLRRAAGGCAENIDVVAVVAVVAAVAAVAAVDVVALVVGSGTGGIIMNGSKNCTMGSGQGSDVFFRIHYNVTLAGVTTNDSAETRQH